MVAVAMVVVVVAAVVGPVWAMRQEVRPKI
jgi:hypothetical protein